ncbi:SWIB/MDM2 domain-containing protein [Roseomonas sp. CCTCC AB2023176]|uniref:SWIB/MDM2 domain-containing protein n=1 Tax=Roseomonas sp. CCTCC AB2023176 TaxID=3342640 RepID=UPI0035DC8A38
MAKTPTKPAKPAEKPAKAAPKAAAKTTTAAAKPEAGKKKAAPKTTETPKTGKPNALQTPLTPSPDLAAVVGEGKMARGAVVSKVWEYIKANGLQDQKDKRQINADDKLKKVFGGAASVSMFEMNKHLAKHLS